MTNPIAADEWNKLEVTELLAGEMKKAGLTQEDMRKRLNMSYQKWSECMDGDFTMAFVSTVLYELGFVWKCDALRITKPGDLWIYEI